MREAVEKFLVDTGDGEVDFVALYSAKDQQYSLYRVSGTLLQEVFGCDCEGPAAPLGHRLMHERYTAARSMETLDPLGDRWSLIVIRDLRHLHLEAPAPRGLVFSRLQSVYEAAIAETLV